MGRPPTRSNRGRRQAKIKIAKEITNASTAPVTTNENGSGRSRREAIPCSGISMKRQAGLARVQDHNDLLEMVRFDFETTGTVEGKLSVRRRTRLHRQFITLATNVSMDFVVGVADHVQDHLLAHAYVDLLSAGDGLALGDGDVDSECIVRIQ